MINPEREKYYKSIWDKANKLRGAIDNWDFKQYFLGFLFYRYISEDFENLANELVEKDYSSLNDDDFKVESIKQKCLDTKGYFIYPSQLFKNLIQRLDSNNLNIEIEKIFIKIEESVPNGDPRSLLKGLLRYMNLHDTHLGAEIKSRNTNIKKIIETIASLEIEDDYAEIYSYLLEKYLCNSGRVNKNHFTPSEVSDLLVELIVSKKHEDEIQTIYDPACGTGSTLLSFLKKLKNSNNLQFFGQDVSKSLYDLCRMNFLFHKVNHNNFHIEIEDTLKNDKFKDHKFDVIISDLPSLVKWGGEKDERLKNDPRFSEVGVLAPKRNGEIAFFQHSVHHLKDNGLSILIFQPRLLLRINEEQKIREHLVSKNYIETIIQLPERLFLRVITSSCAAIINKSKRNNDILFVKAYECFTKGLIKNKLSLQNIKEIVDYCKNEKQIEGLIQIATLQDIQDKDYNLALETYIPEKTEKKQRDIKQVEQSLSERSLKINELRKEIEELKQHISLVNFFESRDEQSGLSSNGWELKIIGEITNEIYTGCEVTRVQLDTGIDPAIKCGDINSGFSLYFSECISFVDSKLIKNKKRFRKGDILISNLSNKLETLGKPTTCINESIEGLAGDHVVVLRHQQNTNYLVHAMSSIFYKQQIHKNAKEGIVYEISLAQIKQIKIPLPPIYIQEKIADFLDRLLSLKEELKEELKERIYQYEYYLNSLIADENENESKYKLLNLHEITKTLYRGSYIPRTQRKISGCPLVMAEDVNTFLPQQFTKCINFVDPNLVRNKKFFEYGDVLISDCHSKLNTVGKAVLYMNKNERGLVGSQVIVIRPAQNPKYLFYALSSDFCREQLKNKAQKTMAWRINIEKLKQIQVPFPSIEEQEKIVSILDKLFKIHGDIKNGIPRLIEEIDLEYEYYRDKIIN